MSKARLTCATPELKAQLKAQSGSSASDFIRFDDIYYSLVALVGDRPVALIMDKKRSLSEPLQDEQEVFIDIIEVLPEYQRWGIGTVLMGKALAWVRENQVTQVRAWSEEIRFEALILWNKLGFAFSQVDFDQEVECTCAELN